MYRTATTRAKTETHLSKITHTYQSIHRQFWDLWWHLLGNRWAQDLKSRGVLYNQTYRICTGTGNGLGCTLHSTAVQTRMYKKSIKTCDHDASLADLLARDVAALLAGALARQSALHLPIKKINVLWRQPVLQKSGRWIVISSPTRISSKSARCSNWQLVFL